MVPVMWSVGGRNVIRRCVTGHRISLDFFFSLKMLLSGDYVTFPVMFIFLCSELQIFCLWIVIFAVVAGTSRRVNGESQIHSITFRIIRASYFEIIVTLV